MEREGKRVILELLVWRAMGDGAGRIAHLEGTFMLGRRAGYCWLVLLCGGMAMPAATRRAGKGKTYSTPGAAINASSDGDLILIDAGSYPGDVCVWQKNRLTIRSAGGRARIDAQGKSAWGKGIWVVGGNDTTIEGVEFSGAAVPSNNGAGIRLDGRNLTVRDCYFHHNQNGILTASNGGEVVIEYSEFSDNGAGDGYSHNMYIGVIDRFTLRYSYSHRSNVGHLVKSRAAVNVVEYNRLTDETGTASYELDLPNGGISYVVGNYFQQSSGTSNARVLAYSVESATNRVRGGALYVVNNTFVNHARQGTPIAVLSRLEAPVVVQNNLFVGFADSGWQSKADVANNVSVTSVEAAGFVDGARYDFRLRANSPAVDSGKLPGAVNGVSLAPVFSFSAPHCRVERKVVGKAIDVGAYEFGSKPPAAVCGAGKP